jgi:hypothetical protein
MRFFATLRRVVICVAIGASALAATPVFAATQAELEAQLQALAAEVGSLRSELAQMKAEKHVVIPEEQIGLTPDTPTPTGGERAATGPLAIGGYGEIKYDRPTDDTSETTADASRFVLAVNYQFDDKTRLISELEFEHAVTSADDPGEAEVEQMYIERELNGEMFAKGGLFLIPTGLLNENHEPTRYYGVFRNHVETQIIPTTWREGGAMVEGKTQFGLRWDVGVTTGFNLSKWDPASEEGRESPLGSIHQELALAAASDLSGFVALNYTGVPGLLLGGSVFAGNSSQGKQGFDDNRVTLWEGHARWTPGRWDLAALYARAYIDNTADINATFVGNPTLIPQSFFGWYTQVAYQLFQRDTASLYPFVRFERVNTASDYAKIAPGLTPQSASDQDIIVGGLSFNFANGVVLKADYQHFDDDESDNEPSNQFDLGIGYQF